MISYSCAGGVFGLWVFKKDLFLFFSRKICLVEDYKKAEAHLPIITLMITHKKLFRRHKFHSILQEEDDEESNCIKAISTQKPNWIILISKKKTEEKVSARANKSRDFFVRIHEGRRKTICFIAADVYNKSVNWKTTRKNYPLMAMINEPLRIIYETQGKITFIYNIPNNLLIKTTKKIQIPPLLFLPPGGCRFSHTHNQPNKSQSHSGCIVVIKMGKTQEEHLYRSYILRRKSFLYTIVLKNRFGCLSACSFFSSAWMSTYVLCSATTIDVVARRCLMSCLIDLYNIQGIRI